MKITNSLQQNVVLTSARQKEDDTSVKRQEKGNQKQGSINASTLNLMQGDIESRKKQAQLEAMKYVQNQFKADGDVDNMIQKNRDTITENKAKADEAAKEIGQLEDSKQTLMEEYGISEDGQEQQDLELYMKYTDSMKPGSNTELTDEEQQRLEQMGPLTDYQKQVMNINSSQSLYMSEMDDANKQMAATSGAIRGIKQEMLKQHGMDDAKKLAEKSLEAASDEIKGMLMQETKEKIEEEQQEVVDEAKEKAEEKAEQEAKLAETAAEKEKAEQQVQANQQAEQMPDLQQMQGEIQQNIKELLENQKLLGEDLKGIDIDQAL